jgi:DNA polymerase-1
MTPPVNFRSIWACDFEYSIDANDQPKPICMVALEIRKGLEIRLWGTDLTTRSAAPFPITPDTLFLAYATTAELSCFQVLGWAFPQSICDLYVEFRHLCNGRYFPQQYNLPSAMASFGLDSISVAEKTDMQQLALRGMPFTAHERQTLLDYCASDVYALAKLFPAMVSDVNLPQALLRGRYMAAITRIHQRGIPLDIDLFETLKDRWEGIRKALIDEVDLYVKYLTKNPLISPNGYRGVLPATFLGQPHQPANLQ